MQEVRKHLHTPVSQNQQIQQFKLSLGHVGFLSLNLLNHSSNWSGPKSKANQNRLPRGPDNVLRQWNKINSLSQHPIKKGSQHFGSQTAAPSSPPLHDSISECMHHWSRKLCVQLLDQPQEFLRVKTYFSSRLSGSASARRYFAYLCHKISQPPALLALLFRKLWNFQLYQNLRSLASSLLSHMPTWCHAFWQQISKLFGNTHSSQNKLVGWPLSQNPHKVFIRQSLCLGQSFATQNIVSTRHQAFLLANSPQT